jgi:Mg2+/Co2+ transporter CorB
MPSDSTSLSPPSLLRRLLRWLMRLVRRDNHESAMEALRDDIAGAIAIGHSGGAMEKDARDRLLGALDLSHRTVDEIMRHRRQIEMIDADLPPGEIITRVLASPYTRLPIFRGSDDTILGVVHAKDLLREVDRLVRGEEGSVAGIAALDIEKVAMKPYFIPETTTLDEQMRAFLARRTHFALVVDEYGTLQGLITLEDILEEIVGEFTTDPATNDQCKLTARADGGYLVNGRTAIRVLNRALGWHLPTDGPRTLNGLVMEQLEAIPEPGARLTLVGHPTEIIETADNRVKTAVIWPNPETGTKKEHL